jgi:nucleoside-diphosphate-sugar epimerase
VPFNAIAEIIASRLGLPAEARESGHFGWFAHFAGATMSVSSARTRELLDWKPQGPGLLTDLDQPGYYP